MNVCIKKRSFVIVCVYPPVVGYSSSYNTLFYLLSLRTSWFVCLNIHIVFNLILHKQQRLAGKQSKSFRRPQYYTYWGNRNLHLQKFPRFTFIIHSAFCQFWTFLYSTICPSNHFVQTFIHENDTNGQVELSKNVFPIPLCKRFLRFLLLQDETATWIARQLQWFYVYAMPHATILISTNDIMLKPS